MLELWTIYDKPDDFPGGFVARKWLLDQPTSELLQNQTLEGIRAMLPHGLMCLPRAPEDDPRIVETWI